MLLRNLSVFAFGLAARESLFSRRTNNNDEPERKMKDIKELTDQLRQIAYNIHVYHGHGHLEKVYENALANRLRKAGLEVRQQQPITVFDEDGTIIDRKSTRLNSSHGYI